MSAVRRRNVAKIQTTYAEEQALASDFNVRKRRRLYRRLSIFLIFAISASYFMVSSILSQTSAIDAKKDQKKQLVRQLSDLKKQQGILKDNIVKLNDDDYIAKLARKDYFFSDKNEIIFNIPDEKKGKSTND